MAKEEEQNTNDQACFAENYKSVSAVALQSVTAWVLRDQVFASRSQPHLALVEAHTGLPTSSWHSGHASDHLKSVALLISFFDRIESQSDMTCLCTKL